MPSEAKASDPEAESESGQGTMLRLVPKSSSVEVIVTALQDLREEARTEWRKEKFRQAQASLVFAYWAKLSGHDRTFLDPKRERTLMNRLRENCGDVDELLYVVDGSKKDDFLSGRDPRAHGKHDQISTIFRDREQVERLAGLCEGYRTHQPHRMALKYPLRLNP